MTLLVRSTCDYDSKKQRFCDCHEAGPVQSGGAGPWKASHAGCSVMENVWTNIVFEISHTLTFT